MVFIRRYFKFIAKIFILVIILIVILTYKQYKTSQKLYKYQVWRKSLENENMKYILIWSNEEPDFGILKKEQEAFIENKCPYSNCYVTKERNFTNLVYTNFDAIVISGRKISDIDLPTKRYSDQTFVFASKESADNYPVCYQKFDNYFNVTWSYKLNSDIVWTYYTVFDKMGKVVAPSVNTTWITDMDKFPKEQGRELLRSKTHPVAWFSSNCYTRSKRESFVLKLKQALKWFGLEIHVVGTCGTLKCPIEKDEECTKILRSYYFYLAFENSFATDYVSEKVLKALLHYTVPVVFGGADYSKFLPPGSYINARELGPKKTATKLASLMVNQTAYLEYFNWHNHYTINVTSSSVCSLCELLNKGEKRVQKNFRDWWNPTNETCRRRNKRTTIRSKILSALLGSTCSLEEAPYLISFFKGSSNIYSVNKAFMARKHMN